MEDIVLQHHNTPSVVGRFLCVTLLNVIDYIPPMCSRSLAVCSSFSHGSCFKCPSVQTLSQLFSTTQILSVTL